MAISLNLIQTPTSDVAEISKPFGKQLPSHPLLTLPLSAPPIPSPQIVLDLLSDAVCIVDASDQFLFVNAAFERILGYAPEDVVGRRAFEFVHPEDLPGTLLQVEQIMAGELQRHFRNRYLHKDGYSVDMQWSAKWHPTQGVRIAVGREVGELRRAEEELEYLARHDQLTGLPNRHHLLQELQRITQHAGACGISLAVLFIDLDGFKGVNDTSGHEAGDQLLREVAARLKASMRTGDTVARVGGDEFVVILPDCGAEGAQRFVEFIRGQLNTPYHLPFGMVNMGASIGVGIFPGDGADPSTLLAHADRDMYAIKSQLQR